MVFVRDAPLWQFAILHPGGVAMSRDGGTHWIPLPEVTSPIDRPFAGWFDNSRYPSLFVALRGHGVIRIRAPFATLAAVHYRVAGVPTPPLSTVFAVDETSGRATPLAPAGGDYRGVEVIDAAAGRFSYHYEVRSGVEPVRIQKRSAIVHTITPGEATAGDIELGDAW
jgi:hypothetical protein